MNRTLSLKISVLGLQHTDAAQILLDFISSARQHYDIIPEGDPRTDDPNAQAYQIILVPFSERERIRIDFNIFASEFEAQHPDEPTVYFKLESI